MSEEEKKDKNVSKSGDSENKDDPKYGGSSNSMATDSTEVSKNITFNFDIPEEDPQRLCNVSPAISEKVRWVYMLDELNKFFDDRNEKIAVENSYELNSGGKLNISLEDLSSSKSFKEYSAHIRSVFREPDILPDFSENAALTDSSRCSPSSLREESISPIPVCSEPLPSFTSTFGRPLRNIHPHPASAIGPLQSEVPQITVAEADSSTSTEECESSTMDVSETGNDLQGDEFADCIPRNVSHEIAASGRVYADNFCTIFKYLLQDLLDLQSFLVGRNPDPWEPSTSSGYSGSIVDLAAISEHFGTGVESNAAIATRHFLEDIETAFNASIITQALRDRKHRRQRTSHRISPISPRPEKCNSSLGKKPPSGSSKRPPSPRREPATLDPEIEESNVPEVTSRLRGFNASAEAHLENCINITREVIGYCSLSSPQTFMPRLERLVGEVIEILRKLVTLREECSSLLLRCTNRNDYAGVVYILKVKTQIATGYNEVLQQLLTFIATFRNDSCYNTETQK